MKHRIVHGTPVTPKALLPQLEGSSFCVSFADPRDAESCIKLVGEDEILVLDNGAFTIWQQELKGNKLPKRLRFDDQEAYRLAFWAWANDIMDRCPDAVAVIPDVIGGDEHANLQELTWALREGLSDYPERCMAIWHTNDSFEQLETICKIVNFVGIGSCQEHDIQKHRPEYLARLREASAHIDYVERFHARRPWVHLMRGLGLFHQLTRFESADSSNVARNHCTYKGAPEHVRLFAARIADKINTAATVAPVGETYATNNFEDVEQFPARKAA